MPVILIEILVGFMMIPLIGIIIVTLILGFLLSILISIFEPY